MTRTLPILPTTVVGSYPQPAWLVDGEALRARSVPRVRAPEIWRVPAPHLSEAQDDATILAIRDMERAGIDIVTDGEIRRESYSNHFAAALEGIDRERPGEVIGRTGKPTAVPRVTGRVRRAGPVEARDVAFCRANTDRPVKITLPGPFTMTRQAQNDFYAEDAELAMDLADALNAEIRDLKAAGADVIQLDEPWMQAFPDEARRYAVPAINRALAGIEGTTVVHLCFGYAAMVDREAHRLLLPARAVRGGGRADLDRGRAAAGSTSRCCGTFRARRSCSASSTSPRRRWRRRRRWPSASAPACASSRPSGWSRRRIAA